MEKVPSSEELKFLIVSICEEQEKIRRVIGPPKSSLQSQSARLEALKTPIYFVWEMLGCGNFSQNRTQRIWLSSFKTSPPDYLSECIMQIKCGEIPVDDRDLSRSLIDFYSELIEEYNQKKIYFDKCRNKKN